jgi:DNA topoisomerase-1
MAKHLLIVESPAKAKTISKYLAEITKGWKEKTDFDVQASFGHIRDLPKDDSAIDVAGGFEPIYIVPNDKREQVDKLKKISAKCDAVWLATDEDREGEAIAWHLCEVLEIDPATTRRIVFNEITRPAIQRAIENPRALDMALVDAQQARRVLDRLVGFELSPILWKKVRYGLSAGRVQSVALRLIVEREREITSFAAQSFFHIQAELQGKDGRAFKATLTKKLKAMDAAEQFLTQCRGAGFSVAALEKKPGKRTPAAPFTTSTLQQEASRKLGYSVAQTMRLAQTLYEEGHITYMRTDSVTLSDTALQGTRAQITEAFGERYHKQRVYSNKTANAQEAHEAIRPTDFSARSVAAGQEQRLYELIWKRTLASQMADAELERTVVDISVTPRGTTQPMNDSLTATGEVITFDGFLKLYLESRDEDDDAAEDSGLLPPLTVGQALTLNALTATERFTRPPARYTEASLVKALEERGIGRPSTYAPTISTVQKREYVIREDREGTPRSFRVLTLKGENIVASTDSENTGAERSKLFPTDLGSLVTDFLVENFPKIIDYDFTKHAEEEFDQISRGELPWREMMDEFYTPFHEQVEATERTAARVQGERPLGTDPKTGKPVLARLGRYGPIAQIGSVDDPEKTFASLRPNQRLETLTLEQALDLFRLPRQLGEYESQEVVVNVGRFGPYIRHAGAFVSLPKGEDPFEIELTRSIELIEAKRKVDRERIIQTFEGSTVQVLNGRWGAYITDGEKNAKIPKGTEPTALTLDECLALIEAAPAPTGRFAKKGKGAKGKAAAKAPGTPKAKRAPARRTPRTGERTEAVVAPSKPARKAPVRAKVATVKPKAKASAKAAVATVVKPAAKPVAKTKAAATKTVSSKTATTKTKPAAKAAKKSVVVKTAKTKADKPAKAKLAEKKSDKKAKKKGKK